MKEFDDVFAGVKRDVGHVRRRVAQLGRATDGTINAGDGYVYVRPQEGGETRAKNVVSVSTHVPGGWVEIGENTRTGELEVLGVASENLYAQGVTLTARLNQPDVAPEHFAGVIPGDAINDLRIRPPDPAVGGLNVCIEAGWTSYGYHAKEHKSVADYLPSTSGMRWWVVGYLDYDNNLYFSTARSVETALPAAFMVQVPTGIPVGAVPYGAYPLYAFILEVGQTEVTPANTLFKDIRYHFDANGITAPGWLVKTPTTIPTGASMVQAGTVRVTSSLTVSGQLYVI